MIWKQIVVLEVFLLVQSPGTLARVSGEINLVTGPVKGIYTVPHVTIRDPTFMFETTATCECRVQLVTHFTAMTIEDVGVGVYKCKFTNNPRPLANVTISPYINTYFIKKYDYWLGSRSISGNVYISSYCFQGQRVPISSLTELRMVVEFVAEETAPTWYSGWLSAKYDSGRLIWPDGSVTTAEEMSHEFALIEAKDLKSSCFTVDSRSFEMQGESCTIIFKEPNFICFSSSSNDD